MLVLTLSAWLACSAPPPAAPEVQAAAPVAVEAAPTPVEPPSPPAPIRADLHVDTPTQVHRKGLGFDAPTGLEAGLAQVRAGGSQLLVEVLWPPRDAEWRAHAFMLLEKMEAELARLEDITLVRSPEEARGAVAEGKVALTFGLEGAHGLGEDWRADLQELHARGLTVLGLTWSFSNRFASSSSDGGSSDGGSSDGGSSDGGAPAGLSADGHALVAEARRLGVVIDLSHASHQTTMEVCAGAPTPVIASHSDVHALKAHARNLTDEEIRCVADSGGVIGVNLHAPFLPPSADIKAAADVADHIAAVGGYGAVALGSDYDGLIRTPAGLPDASALPALWAELERRGWTRAQLEGAQGENYMRAWTQAQAFARQAQAAANK